MVSVGSAPRVSSGWQPAIREGSGAVSALRWFCVEGEEKGRGLSGSLWPAHSRDALAFNPAELMADSRRS